MGVRCSKGHELTPQGHEGHVRLQVIEQYVDCCDCRNQPTRELEGKMITIRRRDSFVDVSFQSLIELFDDRLREGGLLLNGRFEDNPGWPQRLSLNGLGSLESGYGLALMRWKGENP